MKKFLGAVCIATLSISPLMAHALWAEKAQDSVKVYYGDWNSGKKEETGKRLDAIKAEVVYPEKIVTKISREADHILLSTTHKGDVGVVEPIAPRKSRLSDTINFTTYMGRSGRAESKVLLPLDIVPVSPESNEFTVMLDGKPLPKASITLWGPPKWNLSLRSDDNGKVTFETPWEGEYLAEVKHVDATKGEVNGVKYDQKTLVMTISFKADKGIKWENKK